jgi:hypothetical protein
MAEIRRDLEAVAASKMLLLGTLASFNVRSLTKVHHISDAGFRVFSQWGEDGIIEWLLSPKLEPSFVEIGVGNYSDANTRFLLRRHNWRGLIVDCNEKDVAEIRRTELMWRYDLTAVHRFIDASNIDDVFSENDYLGEIGLLSIDIDGQDYWIWKRIEAVNPQIVICEYNAVLGDLHPITVPLDADFNRTHAHPSNLYWGASIVAIQRLARDRAYTLIGSNREGCNAFFVRDDLLPALDGCIQDHTPKPSLFREPRLPTTRNRTSPDQTKPSVDQWSGRENEPNPQRGDRTALSLRKPRPTQTASRRLPCRLQLRQTPQNPQRINPARIRLQKMDGRPLSL